MSFHQLAYSCLLHTPRVRLHYYPSPDTTCSFVPRGSQVWAKMLGWCWQEFSLVSQLQSEVMGYSMGFSSLKKRREPYCHWESDDCSLQDLGVPLWGRGSSYPRSWHISTFVLVLAMIGSGAREQFQASTLSSNRTTGQFHLPRRFGLI